MTEFPILYFLFSPGCSHCIEAKPHVTKLENKYAAIVRVERMDITTTRWPEGLWAPKGTPTYVLVRPNSRPRYREGVMTLTELEDWIGLVPTRKAAAAKRQEEAKK